MSRVTEPVKTSQSAHRAAWGDMRIGQLLWVDSDGRPMVDFPGNSLGPLKARVAMDSVGLGAAEHFDGTTVLMVLEESDPRSPIILGFVRDKLIPDLPDETVLNSFPPEQSEVRADDKVVLIEASEQVAIRCGKSSITLRQDGKVVIWGTNIVSRASGTNRIKGGSVAIN